MRKPFFIASTLLFISINAFSQTDDEKPETRRYTHQVGVQVNELIRQVFNFNSNTANTANTNPYLLVYHINARKSGLGLRIGLGYNYQNFTNDDGITRQESTLNDFRGRFGFEKMFHISRKWTAGAGIDGVFNSNNDYTKSTIRSFDTTTTIITSKIQNYGGGGMAWLRYQVGRHILIGTETSFYYTTGNQKDDVSITKRKFSGQGNSPLVTSTTSVDNNKSAGSLSIPVAFYLLVQF